MTLEQRCKQFDVRVEEICKFYSISNRTMGRWHKNRPLIAIAMISDYAVKGLGRISSQIDSDP